MTYVTDPKARAGFITDLRALADYLTNHPDIPVPGSGSDFYLCADSYEDGGNLQVDRIARLLGVAVTDETAHGGHYYALRNFGCLVYRVTSIPGSCMARHHAEMSYAGCVTPDTGWE